MGFLKYDEVSISKLSEIVMHETHMPIFIEKNKADVYGQGHWLHLIKRKPGLFPLKLTKKYFKLGKNKRNLCETYFLGYFKYENKANLETFRSAHKLYYLQGESPPSF